MGCKEPQELVSNEGLGSRGIVATLRPKTGGEDGYTGH